MIQNIEQFFEKKKSEKESIDDQYKEYKDKIKDKKDDLKSINDGDDDSVIKNIRTKIKKLEIEMAEKELEIVKLKDTKIKYKKELKDTEEKIKNKK